MTAERPLPGDASLQPVMALIQRSSYASAERALAQVPLPVRATPAWALLQGITQTRLGRVDAACAVLQPLTRGPEPWAAEATAALADLLHLSQQTDALRDLLQRVPGWAQSPRGRLFQARLLQRTDTEQALALFTAIVDGPHPVELQRLAGFDAARLLDRVARYREAHAMAGRVHALAPPFELEAFLARLRLQQRLLEKGAGWCPPRAPAVAGTAFVVSLPRSGTTLLEQMLDAHADVGGIGEHEGVADIARGLVAAGVWPYRIAHLPQERATALQQQYLDSARQRLSAPARCTLDKSLLTWQWLPALAAVLPGATALRMLRDPRDVAVSAYLSGLNAQAFGWVARFDTLRQVIAQERALVPLALQALGIAHETLVYEDLVADPARVMAPVISRLGLAMDAAVLAPERNNRTAYTLSHEAVRQPINDRSIGRWQHYAFAFDDSWQALAAGHDAARRAAG